MGWSSAWGHDGVEFNGKEMRELVETLTGGQSGVTGPSTALKVSQQTVATSTVKVAEGGVVVPATGAGLGGQYQAYNDADLTSPVINPTAANGRKDRLIVRVTAGVAALEVVEGVASGTPAEPSITGDNYLELALITLPASTTNVTDAMITDRRVRLGVPPVICKSTTRPVSPFTGMRIFETDTKRELVWAGSAWERVGWATAAGRTGILLRRAVAQNIPNASGTTLAWDTEDFDSDGIATAGVITLPSGLDGLWAGTVTLTWSAGFSSANSYLTWRHNSTSFQQPIQAESANSINSIMLPMAAGDTLAHFVRQDSGGARTVTAQLHLYRIGA